MRVLAAFGLLGQVVLSLQARSAYPIPPGYVVAKRLGAESGGRHLRHRRVARAPEPEASQGGAVARVLFSPANTALASAHDAANASMIAAENVTNTTAADATNATEAPRAVATNGFMGNPYTGVMVAPLTDRTVSREQTGRLNVKRVKSIACLERMIKDPTHDCDPSQLISGEGDPGLVNTKANVHSTHSSDAVSVAAAAARQAAEAAAAAAEAAKAAASAAAAAEKGHAMDVQKAVQAAAKAAADAAADAVRVNPEDTLASAKDAANAAAEAAVVVPDHDSVVEKAREAGIAAGTAAALPQDANGTNGTASADAGNTSTAEVTEEASAGLDDASDAADDASDAATEVDATVAKVETTSAPNGTPSQTGTFGGNLIGNIVGAFGGGTSLLHAEPPVIVHHKLRRSVNVR